MKIARKCLGISLVCRISNDSTTMSNCSAEYTGDGAGPQEYIWNANVTTDQVNTSPVFFLWIRSIVAQGELVTGPTSPYFNMSFAIAQQPSASSTFSTTTGTAMPTSNPTTTNGPGPTMTGSPSPDTNTTAIGAGVGGGVGGALLLLGAFWFWRRSRNRKANSAKAAGSNISYDPSDTYSPRPIGAKTPDFDPHASPEVPSWHNDPQDVPTNLPSRR